MFFTLQNVQELSCHQIFLQIYVVRFGCDDYSDNFYALLPTKAKKRAELVVSDLISRVLLSIALSTQSDHRQAF
jgi:hypothetical protein